MIDALEGQKPATLSYHLIDFLNLDKVNLLLCLKKRHWRDGCQCLTCACEYCVLALIPERKLLLTAKVSNTAFDKEGQLDCS